MAGTRDEVRPGPGGAKSVRLVVRVSEKHMKALRAFAAKRDQDVSTTVRQILADLFDDE